MKTNNARITIWQMMTIEDQEESKVSFSLNFKTKSKEKK